MYVLWDFELLQVSRKLNLTQNSISSANSHLNPGKYQALESTSGLLLLDFFIRFTVFCFCFTGFSFCACFIIAFKRDECHEFCNLKALLCIKKKQRLFSQIFSKTLHESLKLFLSLHVRGLKFLQAYGY